MEEISVNMEVCENIPEKNSDEVTEKNSDEVPEKNSDEIPDKNSDGVSDELSSRVESEDVKLFDTDIVKMEDPDEILDEVSDKVCDKNPEEVSDKVPEKLSEEIPEKTSDKVPEKISKKVSEKASVKVSEKVSDKSSDIAAKYNFVLTQEIVKTLKCSVCNLYLSYPPVYLISEEDGKYKCGRCTIYTRLNIRAVMYENLAKFMKFPCIFKGCQEKLPWADVRDHEMICQHRTLQCIAPDCFENVLYDKFGAHFKEKHIKLFSSNKLTLENVLNKFGMGVLEKDEKCYVVFYDNDQDRFRICVCSFGCSDKQFDIVLSNKSKPNSIVVSGQNIIPLNERVHCYKCLSGECKSYCHIYRKHRRGVLKYANPKVDRELIIRTFGGPYVVCTVSIVDEKLETEDELDELLMGKDVIIDEVNDEEDGEKTVEENQNSVLSSMLLCPSCNEQMAPPIYECLSGHTMCNSCRVKSEKCSTCEAQIDNTRNYVLEEAVANLKLAGQEPSEEVDPADDKEITCPVSKCFEKIKLHSISNHFKENHITNFHFNNLIIKDVYGYYNVDVLVKDNRTYLVFFDFDDINFGISVCAVDPTRHRYEVKLRSENKKFAIVSTNQKIIPFNDREHCAKCTIGVCKLADHTYRQKRHVIFRRLTTKITRDWIKRAFRSAKMSFEIRVLAPRDSHADKTVRQMFECPICKDYMEPPLHQCFAGHTLCALCTAKLDKCPTCEGDIEETRNWMLEKIFESVDLPCSYASESCLFRAGIKRVAAHETDCPWKAKRVCRETKQDA